MVVPSTDSVENESTRSGPASTAPPTSVACDATDGGAVDSDSQGLSYSTNPLAGSSPGGLGRLFPGENDIAAAVASFGPSQEAVGYKLQVSGGSVRLSHSEADCGDDSGIPDSTGSGTRREITGWSAKSRMQMMKAFAECDPSPLFGGGSWPVMITLTLPRCWLRVVPDGPSFKRLFKVFRDRWRRRWGHSLQCLWKLEFQDRSPEARCCCGCCMGRDDGHAPHIHFFTALPGPFVEVREWLSKTWCEVVAHPDADQNRLLQLAGTGIDMPSALRSRDPKRLAVYFSKHAGPAGGKEYQHEIPEAWQGTGAGPGRFWGVSGLDRPTGEVDLSFEEFVRVRRLLRRWSRSNVFFGNVVTTVRPRTRRVKVARKHGSRFVNRRAPLFKDARIQGGFVLTNGGPVLAEAVAEAIYLPLTLKSVRLVDRLALWKNFRYEAAGLPVCERRVAWRDYLENIPALSPSWMPDAQMIEDYFVGRGEGLAG